MKSPYILSLVLVIVGLGILSCGCMVTRQTEAPRYQVEFLLIKGNPEYCAEIMEHDGDKIAKAKERKMMYIPLMPMPLNKAVINADAIYVPPMALPLGKTVTNVVCWGFIELPSELVDDEVTVWRRDMLGVTAVATFLGVEDGRPMIGYDFGIKFPPTDWQRFPGDDFDVYIPIYEPCGIATPELRFYHDSGVHVSLLVGSERRMLFTKCSKIE